jgi:hypothetical protein
MAKPKRKYVRKPKEEKKIEPTQIIIKSGRGSNNAFGGQQIYPNSEGYYPTMPFPTEEVPNFTFYDAFRRFVGIAASFGSQNASRIASSKLVLAVPEDKEWKNTNKVLVKKHRKELYTKGIKYGETDYIDIDDYDHPVIRTLCHPNDLVNTGSDLINQIVFQLQFFGDSFVYKWWDKDKLNLIQLNPCECVLVHDIYSFSAPKLRLLGQTAIKVKGEGNINNATLEPEEFIHFKIPSPNRQYYGLGFLEMSWQSVLLSQGKTQADISRQKNLLNGDMVLRFDERMSQELMDEAIEAMENKMRGQRNTGNIVGYRGGGDVEIQTLPHAPYELGTPDTIKQEIANAFRYPFAKLEGVNSTEASYTVAYNAWIDDISDLAKHVEDGFTNGLLMEFPEIEEGSKLYFTDIRKTSEKYENEKVMALWTSKVIDRHRMKILMKEEVSPEDKGIYYKGTAEISLGKMDKTLESADIADPKDTKDGKDE